MRCAQSDLFIRYMKSGSSIKTALHLQSQALQLIVSCWTVKITEMFRNVGRGVTGPGELSLKCQVVELVRSLVAHGDAREGK